MGELIVNFNPVAAVQRVAKWHGVFRSRVIMLIISVAISVGVYFWQRAHMNKLTVTFLIIFSLIPVVWVIVALTMELIARKDLASLDDSAALLVNRGGLRVRDVDLPWRDLRAVTSRAGAPGRSPQLVVVKTDDTKYTLPLNYLDKLPGEIDDAVRSFSAGRFSVDLSGLGN